MSCHGHAIITRGCQECVIDKLQAQLEGAQKQLAQLEAFEARQGSTPSVVVTAEDGRRQAILTTTPATLTAHLSWLNSQLKEARREIQDYRDASIEALVTYNKVLKQLAEARRENDSRARQLSEALDKLSQRDAATAMAERLAEAVGKIAGFWLVDDAGQEFQMREVARAALRDFEKWKAGQ